MNKIKLITNTKSNLFIKSDVSFHEYNMHNFISNLQILNVPKIINYDKKLEKMTMEKIPTMSLSDYYGESIDQVPETIVKEVRQIIGKLQANNITYPDITGYNFINFNDKIWIIDFEHCYFDFEKSDGFVNKFVKGLNSWNPYFK
jgi:tRNA A-37 threonylcarbamoyl transferase component Bud32